LASCSFFRKGASRSRGSGADASLQFRSLIAMGRAFHLMSARPFAAAHQPMATGRRSASRSGAGSVEKDFEKDLP
jgi:hypothetical protein